MESDDDSSAELRPDDFSFERSSRPVVGVLTGRSSDFTDQSDTARSSKLRIVSRHPTGLPLRLISLVLILRTALLVDGVGGGPVDRHG